MKPDGLKAELASRLPICFGVSGPLGTPISSQKHVASLVAQAIDLGVTVFDTAPAYGAGTAEQRLGRALQGQSEAFVSTKAGVTSAGLNRRLRDFSPASITQSVEDSLKRLGRDQIDLLWLHGPGAHEITDDLSRALEELKTRGDVRFIGAADRGLQAEKLMAAFPFDALMLPINRLPHRSTIPVYAIELLAGASLSTSPLSGRGGFWRFLKTVFKPGVAEHSDGVVADRLKAAARTSADVLCTTTTKPAHLTETVNTLRPLLETRPPAR